MSSLTILEALVAATAFAAAVSLRPWRRLRAEDLPWPWLAWWVVLPLLWSLERLAGNPAVQAFSGVSLLVLMAGWPLAMLGLLPVAVLSAWLGPLPAEVALSRAVWLGVLPGTLALLLGAVVRRCLPGHLMIYILGRGFIGTWLAAGLCALAAVFVHPPGGGLAIDDLLIARWLTASGEAALTGMVVSIFVAFRPEWLATYADRLYLPRG